MALPPHTKQMLRGFDVSLNFVILILYQKTQIQTKDQTRVNKTQLINIAIHFKHSLESTCRIYYKYIFK